MLVSDNLRNTTTSGTHAMVQRLRSRFFTPLLVVSLVLTACEAAPQSITTSRYDVTWDSPSKDYSGSMPLGNGDISLNAWVEKSGDLLFYIGKTDSWDAYGRLLKVGRIRVSLSPTPPMPPKAFRQTLSLSNGTMLVRFGEEDQQVELRVWVDAHHPLIHVEVTSAQPTKAVASIELWRTTPETIPSIEAADVLLDYTKPDSLQAPMIVEPDSLLTGLPGRIGWYHRNSNSMGPTITAKAQGLEDFARPDPLLHRVFGGVVTANKAERIDDTHLQSLLAKRHVFSIVVHTKQPVSSREWLESVDRLSTQVMRTSHQSRRNAHERWWRAFWQRSWIHVSSPREKEASESSDAFVVSRAYALQRYINACAGRGRYPIKFNGSIFTVPYPGKQGDADYRRWGQGYWWQNTRLPYISMCASGDFDLQQPLFAMYAKDLMPLFRYRTKHYLGNEGIYIPECIYFWGDVFSATYGWTPFNQRKDKLQESGWHKWEWISGPELAWMALDYYEFTHDTKFLKTMALPTAREVLTFFDQHYGVDSNGIMVMHPSQALETWWDCTNPAPEIAGLSAVIDRLESLPTGLTTAELRTLWNRLKVKLPSLPRRFLHGRQLLAPAERFDQKRNIENADLYAVFPFRLATVGKPLWTPAFHSFKFREDRGTFGWRQDDIFAAYLGLTDTAKAYLVERARNKDVASRFPAFWGPNYDWTPDQDHGSIILKTLQAMLLQTDGRNIHLFPAWPKDWNVDFKLHAPHQTTIEGKYVDGKLVSLRVTPTARAADISKEMYRDGRPRPTKRMNADDEGIILRHGDGPDSCDIYGAREAIVFEDGGRYYLHYDGAGKNGWQACLAVSEDWKTWSKKGAVLPLGDAGAMDSKSASAPWVIKDGETWHMFYLGTPNTTPPPDRIPSFPYVTMKAKSAAPEGPWHKQYHVVPFAPVKGSYYEITASPGYIVRAGSQFLQFFSAAQFVDSNVVRTLSIARTSNLDGSWKLDDKPIVPLEEQIENSSLYFEPTNKTWFLFTNHIGIDATAVEYTDAIWVYWSKNLNTWDVKNKAVVLDSSNCTWAKGTIGMPSVIKVGKRLAVFYDGRAGTSTEHMRRDIGLAWLELPLRPVSE